MKRRFPLHVHISTLFVALILLVGGIIGGLGYRNSQTILQATAGELNTRISRETLEEFTSLIGPAEMAARLLSYDGVTQAKSLAERLKNLGFMREALNNSAALTSLYVGYGNGDFFMVRRFRDPAEGTTFNAPPEAAYMVQSIERGSDAPRGSFIFFDAALKLLRSDDLPDYAMAYDPRTRDWYAAAQAARGQIKTAPYLFFTSQKVGTTIANRASNADAVVGADILLETLDRSLAKQKVTPGSHVVLANRQGYTIAYEDPAAAAKLAAGADGKPGLARLGELGIPVLGQLETLLPTVDENNGRDLALTVAGAKWHAALRPVRLEGAAPLFLITVIPDAELMASAQELMRHSLIATVLVILLAIPVTWWLARAISGPMRQLAGEAEAIRRFEFSQPIRVDSLVLEVNDLAVTMDSMKRTIRRFLDINMAVAAEHNFDRLLPRLLGETLPAAGAEAGILFLADNDQLLPATALQVDGRELPPPETPAVAPPAAGPLLAAALAAGAPRAGALTPEDVRALGLAPALAACPASHAIAVPLLNRQDQLVGAMLLLCRSDSDPARLSFVEALSGSVAVSLESKELIKAQKLLFEAFIQLIASAIDAKSPYTGGHCARVPELTKMLARAACAETGGPYKDFQLGEEEWEAVHVAAWLHDCGKVTTPEYVVDKATKLETLYDRIHEVRMRFEVLKRDAEIACLQAIAAGEPEAAARARLTAELAALDDDFAFIAECNEGGEFMAPEKLERLRAIAARTWLRTLDDRIGISHEEQERKARTPAPALPVAEPLLADKPEHVFERQARDRMPSDNKWGFRMPVPEVLYNKGELYNLGVARGTLSEEERYKINEHIVQTLIMLTQLPFPKHLRNVPEIAAGHHEKMDGTGYPRRLTRDQMSPVARMMAIADIFEALTAVDRPYKKGKTLSEAIRIMSFMKKDHHIDPELFDLFLRSGVYREYAEQYMKPEQIDAVDVAAYLDGKAA
ncbi:HD domain-containing phosphohydrolase [Dechloromonas sp. H13]|uniref:HD domain-containing phosphohydrolase n=1 Tax=Dechloromonas sp. H13 TaxID=2570193 RepID=UPI0012909EA6|nr:HD domain-containing phosphohydrolase [Dechloromonas sp. H13]